MHGLFYRPEPESLITKLLRLAGYKTAENGSTADYPEDWFEEEPADVEEWGEPESAVPKFSPGEHVEFLGTGNQGGGEIVGEPEIFEGDWWYHVLLANGYGTVQASEAAMTRADSYDQPGVTTINDWFGIPPEGEQYYRTAAERGSILRGWDTPPEINWVNTEGTPEHGDPEIDSFDVWGLPYYYDDQKNRAWIGTTSAFHRQLSNLSGEENLTGYHPGRYNHIKGVPAYQNLWDDLPPMAQTGILQAIQKRFPPKPLPSLENQPTWDEILKTGGETIPFGPKPGTFMLRNQTVYEITENDGYHILYRTESMPDALYEMPIQQFLQERSEGLIKTSAEESNSPVFLKNEWWGQVEPYVNEEAKYFRQCPACGGYMQKRGEDIYECTQCPNSILPERYSAADADWDAILDSMPDHEDIDTSEMDSDRDIRPRAFVYSPKGGWIRWGGPNSLHDNIKAQLHQDGLKVTKDCIYGRWYPQYDNVVVYDARLSDEEKAAVAALIQLNAPREDNSVPTDK